MPVEEKVLRNIKLTEEENERLKADAYAHGMNVSAYIRWLVEKERKETAPCYEVDEHLPSIDFSWKSE